MADHVSAVKCSSMLYFLDCRTDSIPGFVRYQLEQYHEAGLRIIVFTFLLSPQLQKDLKGLQSDGVISSFVASKELRSSFAVFERAFANGVPDYVDRGGDVYFSNAQCFGPLIPAAELLKVREASSAAIWGITLLTGREGDFVEPYFLAIRKSVLSDRRFQDAIAKVSCSKGNPSVRMNLLSRTLCQEFGCDTLVHVEDARPIRVFRFEQPFSVNATDFLMRKCRMPFIPVAAFRNRRVNRFPIAGAVVDALRETFPAYPEHLILDHLRTATPLSWTKDYPGTLRVLGVPSFEPTSPPRMRIAVKAHLFYREMLEYAYASFANIPFQFDLLCTTCTDEVRTSLLQEAKGRLPMLNEVKVAKVPNRGRDIGPWLTALTDDEETYDVILKYQTKRRLQQPNVFGEAWSAFINACVLGSPGMVREILAMFASDPELGLVLPSYPPTITITTPSAYVGAPEMMELFESCRKRYAPKAPAETASPVFAAGTVFWYRPKALRALREARLRPEDFPEEPLPPLTVLHAMERIIPYVAQSSGFHYHMVLPYDRLCRSYELLEGRLLSTVPLDEHPPLPQQNPFAEFGFRGLAKATLKAFVKAVKKRSPF